MKLKSVTNKQTKLLQFCPSPLNHWSLPPPLHNHAHTASHTATPWVRKGNWCSSRLSVLRVTGMESTFFMAAAMVLCCGFGSRTVLITRQCFTYSWAVLAQHQSLFFFPNSGPPTSKLQLWESVLQIAAEQVYSKQDRVTQRNSLGIAPWVSLWDNLSWTVEWVQELTFFNYSKFSLDLPLMKHLGGKQCRCRIVLAVVA